MPRKVRLMLDLEQYTAKPIQTKSISVKLLTTSHTALTQLARLTDRSAEELLALLIEKLVSPAVKATLIEQAKKDEKEVMAADASTTTTENEVNITPADVGPLTTIKSPNSELTTTPPIKQPLVQPLAAPSAIQPPSIQSQSVPTAPSFTAPTTMPTQPKREASNTPAIPSAPPSVPAPPTLPKSNPAENR